MEKNRSLKGWRQSLDKFEIKETPFCVEVYHGKFLAARFYWADLKDAHERAREFVTREMNREGTR